MRYTISENSHFGIGLFIFELIISMICLNGVLELLTIKIHPAIRLVICIVTAIILFIIFCSSKIGSIIISLFYSGVWTLIAWNITKYFSNSDKIWMVIVSGVTFIISIIAHLGASLDSGYDYEVTDEN
ncbi:hypothetical protein [Clostridium butyricum]|uniref:hypothetical protein n=1 Tax=Clostridium butyricum TaxID=1492 RepID=UPI003465E1D3